MAQLFFKKLSMESSRHGHTSHKFKDSNRFYLYSFSFFILILLMSIPILFTEWQVDINSDNFLSVLSFFLVGLWSFVSLYFAAFKRPFTLNNSHWIFCLFFLAYAPIVQFLSDHPPDQTNAGGFADLHVKANIFILFWCITYSIIYKITYNLCLTSKNKKPHFKKSVRINLFMLVFMSLFATVAAFVFLGVDAVLSRSLSSNTIEISGKAASLLVNIVCRSIPVVSLAVLLVSNRNKDTFYYITATLLALLSLVLNNPFAVARFWFSGLLIGLLCLFLKPRLKSSLWLTASIVFGLIYVLPILNLGRYTKLENIELSALQESNISSTLTGGDFDAYSMFIDTMIYADRIGVTGGSQLAGNLLFFVPRNIWADKPEGSGQLVAEGLNFGFTNLSEPLPAEGYVNFGALGVIVYASFFAWLFARLDFSYWNNSNNGDNTISILSVFYPFAIGFVIFIMRGDFLSSFAYTSGFLFSTFVVLKFSSSNTLIPSYFRK